MHLGPHEVLYAENSLPVELMVPVPVLLWKLTSWLPLLGLF